MGKPQREVDPFRNELQRFRKALGARIRELRQLRGWSQEEFAARAHVHRTFAGSLERGEKNCSFHSLVLIGRCFGITLSEMFAGLEAGESPAVKPQRRSARRDQSDIDRSLLLTEVATLEQSARVLREIALTQKGYVASSAYERKQRRASLRPSSSK